VAGCEDGQGQVVADGCVLGCWGVVGVRLREVMRFEFVAEVVCHLDQAGVVNTGGIERDGDVDHEQDGDKGSASEGIAAARAFESGFVLGVWVAEDSR